MATTVSVQTWLLFMCIITVSGLMLSESTKIFTIVNNCKETIFPAIITQSENFSIGGFALKTGQSTVFAPPPGWHGRIWGRTGCVFGSTGAGKCQTGNCADSLNCTSSGSRPTSLAEFTLGDMDHYYVSLVDGFNLPIVIIASGDGRGSCTPVGCDSDLRENCPLELREEYPSGNGGGRRVVGCRSSCDVFDTDEYCCRGMYANPVTCLPSNYTRRFKEFCPTAYSYVYDDPTSIQTCSGADYIVSFCGSRNQTACSYYNNKLICNNESNGAVYDQFLGALPLTWALIFLFYFL